MKQKTLDRVLITLGLATVLCMLIGLYGLWTFNWPLLTKLAAVWIAAVLITGTTLTLAAGAKR